MAKEIEVKYLIDDAQITALKASPLLSGDPQDKRLISTYFDTPDLYLKQQKVALRIRDTGTGFVQTIKGEATSKDGMSIREECETPLEGRDLDFGALALTPFAALFTDSVKGALEPAFVTDFNRTCWILQEHGSYSIELALDQGWIIAGDKREAIREVELELLDGTVASLEAVADKLKTSLKLEPFDLSKARRGYTLFRG